MDFSELTEGPSSRL